MAVVAEVMLVLLVTVALVVRQQLTLLLQD
jgi:hypothetical protein